MNQSTAQILAIPTLTQGLKCPQCNSSKHIRNGKEKGTQKYKCKTCGKSFRRSTGSPLYHLKKAELIQQYITCMHQAMPLRQTAKKLGIAYATAFAWRHKLLATTDSKAGIITGQNFAVAEIKLPYSNKGIRKAKQRKLKHTQSIIIQNGFGEGQITMLTQKHKTFEAKQQLKSLNLLNAISYKDNSRLLSRATLPLPKLDQQDVITHKRNLKNQTQAMHDWLYHFRGVASKYLQHYWQWHILTQNQISTDQLTQRLLGSTNSYNSYRKLKAS